MAAPKHADPTHCAHCHRRLGYQRLILARAVTGDLGFCNYGCGEAWRANQAAATSDAPA
jgi:hypothetical protein